MWSHELARGVGIRLPLQAAEHFYVVTEAIADLPRDLPVLRAPDEYAYYKEDAGKLLVGAFEPVAKPWGMTGIPKDFCFDALPNDMDHFMPVLEMAMHRIPALQSTGIATWFNGPESFTPDDRYLLGETIEMRDLFVACGFNSIGIQSSGGAGKVLAQWIVDRQAPMDLADIDVRRMQPLQGTRSYLKARTTESLGLLYAMHWPFRQVETARGVRRSPFHERLLAAGACMGEYGAWERANWYGAAGSKPEYQYSYGRQNWFDHAASECQATRDAVALYDQSSYPKFLVQGRDACRVLNRISCANMDVPIGKIVYTQWLNPRGGIEADLTVTRLAYDQYLVVSAVGTHQRDFAWLREHVPADAHCIVTDITPSMALIGLMGPESRALLQKLSGENLDNAHCPFGHSVEIEIGHAIVRASRLTYVGELGWELYIPTDTAMHVFEQIWHEGQTFGLKPAGFHAMAACRVEKGYRHWGHDIGPEDTPLEAGLGFTVAWDKPGGFVGDDALKRQREAGAPCKRMVQFRLEDSAALLYHDEPIFADGKLVGLTTSGMYGHRLQGSFGMGYVRFDQPITPALLSQQRFEIEVAGQRIAAHAQLSPYYDPKSLRVQA
jgi:glycine cleavage system aminomethyltransferase T